MGNLLLVKLVLVRSRYDLDQSGKFQPSFKTANNSPHSIPETVRRMQRLQCVKLLVETCQCSVECTIDPRWDWRAKDCILYPICHRGKRTNEYFHHQGF